MSIMLSIVMIVLMIPVGVISVSANSTIEAALSWALDIANDDRHQYVLGASHGSEGMHYDCSSFVSWALIHAGIDVPVSTTFYMRENFEPYGFEWIDWSNIGGTNNLQRGDILLDIDTHVEFYYGNNQIIGAHRPATGISVSSYYNNVNGVSWDGVLRYNEEPNHNPTVDLGDKFYATISNTAFGGYLSKTEGTDNLCLQNKNSTSGQLWYFERQEDNAYVISSCYDGKVLEMTNGTTENRTQVSAHDNFWGGYYQQWYVIDNGNGYRLQSKHFTSEGWYLDRSVNTVENGQRVQIYEKGTDEDQTWTINKDSVYADIGDKFYAVINNTYYGGFLSKTDGTNNVYMQDKNNSSKQVWYFERQDNGTYVISSCFDGSILEMTDGIRENRTQVSARGEYWGGYYQQWYFIPSGNGFRLMSNHYTSDGGWYLDRSVNSDNNGQRVQIYERFSSQEDQIWTIDKAGAIADLGKQFYSTISNTQYGGAVSKVEGTDTVYLQDEVPTVNQDWYFERQDDRAYVISSCYDGKVLEMTNGVTENRSQVSAQGNFWGGYYQQWYLIPSGNGYRMMSKHFTSQGWYLDRSVNAETQGQRVQIYERFSSPEDQIWTINAREIPVEPETQSFLGDVDGDGEVTIIDVTCIQRKLASIATANFVEEAADADEDGDLTIRDATVIQRWLAQLPSNENIGKPIT